MFDERVDVTDNVQIGDVLVDKVGFKDVESALHKIWYLVFG